MSIVTNVFSKIIDNTGKLIDYDLVIKSQFVILSTGIIAFLLFFSMLSIDNFDAFSLHQLDQVGQREFKYLTGIFALLAVILCLLGLKLHSSTPNSQFYAHIAVNFYFVGNLIVSYYLGVYSVIAGVGFAAGPILGIILFPSRIIFPGIILFYIAAIALYILTTTDIIPDSPILLDPANAKHNFAWLCLIAIFVIPHISVTVTAAAVCIVHWHAREQKIKYLSCTDTLTKIANRHHLMVQIDAEIERSIRDNIPLSILMVDLDFFKKVNDNYGHQTGDLVIQNTAQILKDTVRKIDHVGRYGGEEFVCVLPNTGQEKALISAQRCCDNVEKAIIKSNDDREVSMTLSIGIDTFMPGAEDNEINTKLIFDTLLKQSDEALYIAKESGRNKAIHYKNQSN